MSAAARTLALAVAPLLLGLSGCSIFSPVPTVELVKVTAAATTVAIAQGPTHASQTVFNGAAVPARVCVEYNRSMPMPDFVPALLAELRQHRVAAKVYEPGVYPGNEECPAWLRYQGLQQWDKPPFSDQVRPFLSQATLSLHDAGGRLLAASTYDSEESLTGMGRWATTRNKLAPVIKALLTGFES